MTDPLLPLTTDGRVMVRAPEPGDARVLIAGRDEAFDRWLGPGPADPQPVGCIHARGQIVGFVDYDTDQEWLEPGEVNVGYSVFAPHRGRGYATRAVRLLLHHLAVRTGYTVASLLIDPANERSLAVAARIGAVPAAHPGGCYFRRPVPPLSYSDGVVTIRPAGPGEAGWSRNEPFGTGPSWAFCADAAGVAGVGSAECDLASDRRPRGEACIRVACPPGYRGYENRVARLVTRFLRDHTGATEDPLVLGTGPPGGGG
jgi:RimJ/RimL family protein N-acetyltransferase